MMVSPGKLSLLSTAVVGLALICAVLGSGHPASSDARQHAQAAALRLDSLTASGSDSVVALSLSYLERARLGLGSPFRLVDEAANDPRLPDSTRKLVAWAILDRVFEHGTYEIDAAVLDALGPRGAGADHLALMERVIRAARDPRVGELTVRLAYGLASAQGTVAAASMNTVVEAAAMIRDRVLSEQDIVSAIPRARSDGVDLIEEIVKERDGHTLAVERPLLGTPAAGDQDAAIIEVPQVLREIESIDPDTSAMALAGRSLIPLRTATVAARLAARRPPSAATRVVLQTRAATLQSDIALAPSVKRFLLAATNEESLVAAYAFAEHFSSHRSVAAARVMVSAAVALRAWAQEPPWFAGTQSTSAGEVASRFGLRRIDFDRGVPSEWRPFYVRMVASALEDMRLVLPGYEPSGLTVRFVMRALPDSALAMHDPRTHTLLLPIGTAAGTLAHELAHDLDWQSARRLFAHGGGYASDRSLHENEGPLARSMRRLAAAHTMTDVRGVAPASDRPAEVFARGVDWFVADVLSESGRSNGNLSAIEDQLIPGYAASMGDAASLAAASSLVNGMAEMTPIPDSIKVAYLDRWQSVDRLDPAAVMARVRAAPVTGRRSPPPLFGVSVPTMTQLTTPSLCVLDRLRAGAPRERLIAWTIDAKATGILLRRARALAPGNRSPWAHALLREVTWDPHASDEMVHRTTAAVLAGVEASGLVRAARAPFVPAC